MRLKSVIKYYISDIKNSVIIFYIVMAAIVVLISGTITLASKDNQGIVSGGEITTIIFIFIVGLNSFKQNFLFLSVNSIPRKLQFQGFLVAALAISGIMAAIDTTYGSILNEIANYESAFTEIYGGWIAQAPKAVSIITGYIWRVALNMSAILAGYFITCLYYKMIKTLKIIVSIGIPALFFVVLPAIDAAYTNGRIFRWIRDVVEILSGFGNGVNPFIGVLSLAVGAAVVTCLSFLLVRSAIVRE